MVSAKARLSGFACHSRFNAGTHFRHSLLNATATMPLAGLLDLLFHLNLACGLVPFHAALASIFRQQNHNVQFLTSYQRDAGAYCLRVAACVDLHPYRC